MKRGLRALLAIFILMIISVSVYSVKSSSPLFAPAGPYACPSGPHTVNTPKIPVTQKFFLGKIPFPNGNADPDLGPTDVQWIINLVNNRCKQMVAGANLDSQTNIVTGNALAACMTRAAQMAGAKNCAAPCTKEIGTAQCQVLTGETTVVPLVEGAPASYLDTPGTAECFASITVSAKGTIPVTCKKPLEGTTTRTTSTGQ